MKLNIENPLILEKEQTIQVKKIVKPIYVIGFNLEIKLKTVCFQRLIYKFKLL